MQTLKEEIRQAILKSASKAFFDDGFEKTSVRLIAYKAGISVANLYSYFPSKEAIFAAVAKPIRIVLREAFNAFLERETKFNWKSDSSARSFRRRGVERAGEPFVQSR